MKTIITYFWVIVLAVLSIAANAQNNDANFQNTLTGKEDLAYEPVPTYDIWRKIAGFNEESTGTEIKASYNSKEHKLIVSGTAINGDVEMWDVNGNTIFDKSSGDANTVLTVDNLARGSYYINYSNGTVSRGVKLIVK